MIWKVKGVDTGVSADNYFVPHHNSTPVDRGREADTLGGSEVKPDIFHEIFRTRQPRGFEL